MLDKKEPFYQLSVCKDFLDLKEVWLGSVDSAIGSAKVLAVSARHSSGSRLVISMAVPVKRRTLWLVERRWVTPAPSSCWKVVKRLLQEIKHTNKHLKKNVDVLRSFGRTFSTFLVSQFIPCFSWFYRFFLIPCSVCCSIQVFSHFETISLAWSTHSVFVFRPWYRRSYTLYFVPGRFVCPMLQRFHIIII